MKVSLLYISIICAFFFTYRCILYFTYSTVCSPNVCHCVNHSVFQCLSQYIILFYNGFNINDHYIHYYKNVFAHRYITTISTFQLSCSEYTNAHAQLNTTWLARLMNTLMKMGSNSRSNLYSRGDSFFTVSEDINSILVDQNFTTNVTGMVIESL